MKDFNYNICFIGMPGSGKTTIGRQISIILGYDFIDLDHLIIDKTGLEINEIFAKNGEKYFRNLERDLLKNKLTSQNNTVISTGGGTILKNKDILSNSYNIYLKCGPDILVKRLKMSKERPLISNDVYDDVNRLLKDREKLYSKLASITINANNGKKKILEEILNEISK